MFFETDWNRLFGEAPFIALTGSERKHLAPDDINESWRM